MIRSGKRRGDNEKQKKKKKKVNKSVDDEIKKENIFSSDDEINKNNLIESPIKNENEQIFDEIDDNINEFLDKNDVNKRGSYLVNIKNSDIQNDEEQFIKHKKTEKFEQKKNKMTEREKYLELKKKKEKRLQKVYNNILKNNFKSQQREIVNYINKFTDKNITPVDNKIGSNLHGFMGDFKKKVNSTNVADIAKKVNDEKRNIYNKNSNLKNIEYNNIQSMMLNVDNLKDTDENINKLEYDYAEQLLELK